MYGNRRRTAHRHLRDGPVLVREWQVDQVAHPAARHAASGMGRVVHVSPEGGLRDLLQTLSPAAREHLRDVLESATRPTAMPSLRSCSGIGMSAGQRGPTSSIG